MKVFVLLKTEWTSDYAEPSEVISVSKTKPDLPEDEEDGCGCCYSRYSIKEMVVQK